MRGVDLRRIIGRDFHNDRRRAVEKAEQLLLDYGFRQVRVRIHDNLARIEVLPEQFDKLMDEKVRTDVVAKLKEYGFLYVTMDLSGYRMGSMNDGIRKA